MTKSDAVAQLEQEWIAAKADGKITIVEWIGLIIEAAQALFGYAKEFLDEPTVEGKREWISDTIKTLYRAVDPDIPFLPGFVEGPLEDYILDELLEKVLDMLFTPAPEPDLPS